MEFYIQVFLLVLGCSGFVTSADEHDLELAELGEILTALNNLTEAQKGVWEQQRQYEQEGKKINRLKEEREENKTLVLEAEQHLIRQIRGKISRKLRSLQAATKNSNGNHYSAIEQTGPKDCADIFLEGNEDSGVFPIWPVWNQTRSFKVYCDMVTDGGGWTVIHRYGHEEFAVDYFMRSWRDYKNGFGDLSTDFWLGNENIWLISKQGAYSIRFDFGGERSAVYENFWIEGEGERYKLHVNNYISGDKDDMYVFSKYNGNIFSTMDVHNNHVDCFDHNYENYLGWWYSTDCKMDPKLKPAPGWRSHKPSRRTNHKGLKFQGTEIKLRPVTFAKMKENV